MSRSSPSIASLPKTNNKRRGRAVKPVRRCMDSPRPTAGGFVSGRVVATASRSVPAVAGPCVDSRNRRSAKGSIILFSCGHILTVWQVFPCRSNPVEAGTPLRCRGRRIIGAPRAYPSGQDSRKPERSASTRAHYSPVRCGAIL